MYFNVYIKNIMGGVFNQKTKIVYQIKPQLEYPGQVKLFVP